VTSLIDILPPRARGRLLALQSDLDDARSLLTALIERSRQADSRLAIARSNASVADPAGPSRARLVAEADAAKRACDAIDQQRAARSQAVYGLEALLTPLSVWAEQFNYGPVGGDGPAFADAEIDGYALRLDGETWETCVDRLYREATLVRHEMSRIAAAPQPLDEIERSIIAQVDRAADAGRPQLDVNSGRCQIIWPDVATHAPGAPGGAASAMFAWLFGDAIKDTLIAAAHDAVGDREGIALAERPALIATLQAQYDRHEIAVEAVLEAARADNVIVPRRGAPSPMALLQIVYRGYAVTAEAAE
jgi:hypothetical protein